MIKNLIFDFGKVLVDYDFGLIRTFFDNDADAAEFGSIFACPDFAERCDRQLQPIEEIVEDMKRRYPKFRKETQTFFDRFDEFVTGEMPGMKQLLEELKRKGYHLYGLTNWCTLVYDTIEQYDIFRLLEGQVISSEEHVVKPEKAIYERLLQRFSLKAEECLFVDDKQPNIDGAKAVGMDAVLFTDAPRLKAFLQEEAIL